ncbi:NAD(P)-binding protein [Cylindrobasidium torrendii FP15055 ss-10]|uniref:NAD(P)-binding protein n=1 Tax=Cylindrobasidium torrendii FP15055 ss-10 TaxID=1314674 RepID=A0A0D7BE89_9AGAR|nr:NAD(P)-binding protein [Cylindrobasidium torrendii FP15055 ss-10]
MPNKPVVFIAGASGNTGSAIARHLLLTSSFTVVAFVLADKLEEALQGVDILISTVIPLWVDQKPIILAASKVGVKRVIPSDFGPHSQPGVMGLHDLKLDVREYIKSLGLSYTFIEVGWWMQLAFPCSHKVEESWAFPKSFYGPMGARNMYVSLDSIGALVGRVIEDERTLNHTVAVFDVEYTHAEIVKIAEEVSGEDFSDYPMLTGEVLQDRIANTSSLARTLAEYWYSLYVREDNTIEKAKADGVLIARELYDSIPIADIKKEAYNFYTVPMSFDVPS